MEDPSDNKTHKSLSSPFPTDPRPLLFASAWYVASNPWPRGRYHPYGTPQPGLSEKANPDRRPFANVGRTASPPVRSERIQRRRRKPEMAKGRMTLTMTRPDAGSGRKPVDLTPASDKLLVTKAAIMKRGASIKPSVQATRRRLR